MDPEATRRLVRERVQAAGVILGEGADDRAYELVAKGLLYEQAEADRWSAFFARRIGKVKSRMGRPKRLFLGIDAHRALYVIYRTKHFERARGQDTVVIREAKLREEDWIKRGVITAKDLLWGTDEKSLAGSVSDGRKELRACARAAGMTVENWLASHLAESREALPTLSEVPDIPS
jgi:hypothetical protein